jgi:signal peptidase I
MILILAVVLVASTATAAFAVLSSGPTGGCLNPFATRYSNQQGSMRPTLLPGDLVLVAGADAGAPFERAEIVVFNPPAPFAGDGTPFIKRVIGLPGETVSFANGGVVVNGHPLEEPYLPPGTTTTMAPQGTTTTSVIGANELFVLGDERANSVDSRSFGAISVGSVTGHATAICAPDDRKTALP